MKILKNPDPDSRSRPRQGGKRGGKRGRKRGGGPNFIVSWGGAGWGVKKFPKTGQKLHKTALKPPKNRHNFHNLPIWWVEMVKILENRVKTFKKCTKTAKKLPLWRFGGFSYFQNP